LTSVRRVLAAPAALVAMIGTVGWVGGPALARGLFTPASALIVTVLALAVGAVVYVVMQNLVAQALVPVVEVAQALRDAAARPRDHIKTYRQLRAVRRSPYPEEFKDLDHAVEFFVRRIEERQVRQAAWAGALVHDVKTPVAAAATALAAVSSDVQTWTGAERDLVKRVSAELRGLASHVQELLDAIRLDREDVDMEVVEVDLATAVRRTLAVTRVPDRVEVSVRGSGHALADPSLLDRVLENLVSNALRYARSQVKITVFEGLVSVADDGPGLPAPLEVLTEPFRSEALKVADETLHGGAAGMGLFLAKRVLELHQGKLVVERSDRTGTILLAYVGRPGRRDSHA